MRLHGSLEILLGQGEAPVIAAKVRYYAEGEFWGWRTDHDGPPSA
jgi:hypothetical protein